MIDSRLVSIAVYKEEYSFAVNFGNDFPLPFLAKPSRTQLTYQTCGQCVVSRTWKDEKIPRCKPVPSTLAVKTSGRPQVSCEQHGKTLYRRKR
jgi:hypothetical protein